MYNSPYTNNDTRPRCILSNHEATLGTLRGSASHPAMDLILLLFLALSISAATFVAIVFDIQFARLIYGQASTLLLGIEIASLITLAGLVFLLRSRLALPSAPSGFFLAVFDFFALRRLHPAIKLCLAGLLALPLAWWLHGNRWMFTMLPSLGRRILAFSDVQNALDGGAVAYQVTLIGGLPLLFLLHLLCRWKPANRFLPWVLVPLFFVGVVIGTVLLVTAAHFSQ
jgi:hypothetical protein